MTVEIIETVCFGFVCCLQTKINKYDGLLINKYTKKNISKYPSIILISNAFTEMEF